MWAQVLALSAGMLLLATALLPLLPTPRPPTSKTPDVPPTPATADGDASTDAVAASASSSSSSSSDNGSSGGSLYERMASSARAFVSMPVLQTRGAQLLIVLRLLLALGFHMFAPLWQVSIKKRFDFAPKDHAQFMGLIGLMYALSQGFVAKPLIARAGDDPSRLMVLCLLFLGGARPFALRTASVGVVYALYVPMVIALGVINTAVTTACARLTSGEDLGGLFGVLESVESAAGMFGPFLGGALSARSEGASLGAVLVCYGAALVLVLLFYGKHVVRHAKVAKVA